MISRLSQRPGQLRFGKSSKAVQKASDVVLMLDLQCQVQCRWMRWLNANLNRWWCVCMMFSSMIYGFRMFQMCLVHVVSMVFVADKVCQVKVSMSRICKDFNPFLQEALWCLGEESTAGQTVKTFDTISNYLLVVCSSLFETLSHLAIWPV